MRALAQIVLLTIGLLMLGGGCHMLFPFQEGEVDGGADAESDKQDLSVADTTGGVDHLPPDAQLDTSQWDLAQSDGQLPQPDAAQPDADAAQPDTAQPDTAQPDTVQPDTVQPDTVQPDTAQPDTVQPDTVPAPDLLPPPDAPVTGCTPAPATNACSAGWCKILKGCFKMGSPLSEPCRELTGFGKETQHEVTLTRDFEIAETEVIQAEFSSKMGYNNSISAGSCQQPCPVEQVNWHEAAAYCNALSTSKGYALCYSCTGSQENVVCETAPTYTGLKKIYDCPGYRLPTEAEWEYAVRGGTTSAFYSGGYTGTSCANKAESNADAIGWYKVNAMAIVQPVGGKAANDWGLKDMAGNVWEWCHDVYLVDLGPTAVTDPVETTGSAPGYNVIRGGSVAEFAHTLRSAFRRPLPVATGTSMGFRCARTLP